ncbi:apolipoprotein N-acyltransferase [Ostreiculturibacter nitratireducens]|uniref:apolipoprotein N-acyltransferase n=1 Tax=Ostreiculturibacter nitratireducens TaxID=3075226 RepID=UPI003CCC6E0E
MALRAGGSSLWLRPGWRRLLLGAALGAVTATGQAPLGLWPVTLMSLSALIALMASEADVFRAARLGWVSGAGYFAGAMFWIVEPFMVEPERYAWMAPFGLLFMAFGMALFWFAAAGAAAWIGRQRRRRVLAFAVALASAELARGYVLTGLPWALLGHIWVGTPVMQAAAYVGPMGLTILTIGLAALPVMAMSRRRGALRLAVGVAIVASLWAFGTLRLNAPEPVVADAPLLRLIQPNAEQHLKWREDMARLFFERQVAQTAEVAERRPDLVIWPETAVPWLLERPGSALEIIAEAAGGAPVALGIQRAEGFRFYNSLAVIDATGTPVSVYDKFHLVPFGEYTPFGDLLADFGVKAFASREGYGYTAGPGAAVIDLGPVLGKVQPLICYEAVFPQDLRAAPERPDWLLQVTNDGWFGKVSGPYQHLAQARLRAVEQGLPLIRVANTGVSAVIDAKGRILRSLPLGAVGIIDAELPPALYATPYARWGDWPVAALLFLALAGLVVTRRSVAPDAAA